ncbi:glycosyltransferase [Frankia sp. ACN1ag]|uniref:glycosyltransferase n=1 Tax=Frankia sp. ACN1ag TaxID=102891 RepID=UPI0006DC0552|nr:glycosyltransferase [Frankia sp. ACN1ag]KQC39114.1 glycosyl transferase [Frankia sp. ACN1ag]
MRVVVATEARFHRGGDDRVLAPTPAEAHPHWCGYLGVFDEVVVLARVGPASPDPASLGPAARASFPVEGKRVRVVALPSYQGPAGYLRAVRSLRSVIAMGLDPGGQLAPTSWQRAAAAGAARRSSPPGPIPAPRSPATPRPGALPARPSHVVDTRYLAVMPGMVGAALITELSARGLPYAMEIIGDAEAVAGGMFGRWARRPARRWLARRAAGAQAVGYVTRETLQRRYPPAAGALTAHYAYGRLSAQDFTAARPRAARPPVPATLVTIGSQDRRYKGHDILLAAVGLLDAWGYRLRVVIVGTGRHHPALVRAAGRAGLTDVVEFVPALDRAGVRAVLDAADLFVLPSRTEGLPRVLIEAMARGVPSIATAVGGNVELLAPQDLVPPEDPERLALRIAEVLASPGMLAAMSARNRAAAEDYRGDRLAARASAFYAALAGNPPADGAAAPPPERAVPAVATPAASPPVRTPQPTGRRS